LDKLADVLVNYSVRIQRDDLVRLSGSPTARPLLVALYRAVLQAGGHPHVEMLPDECAELKLRLGSEEQLRFEDPLAMYMVERIDASISVGATENTKALSGTDPKRQAMVGQARKKQMARFLERAALGELHWVYTQLPCQAAAQEAQMSLEDYEDFVFRAGRLDEENPAAAWRDFSRQQQLVVDYLNEVEELRLTTPQGTDLRLSVAGRAWLNCDGHENFPDGEVFTGPVEDATEGVVCYSFPAVYGGREVNGIRLEFRQGRVVEASATQGEEFLVAMLDQDPGARVLGEIALGTNYSVQRFTKNTLFDEKIGGTFHAALGAAYPETGGLNQSALHWDMVCDLRQGGCVYANGTLISEKGRFLDSAWPQP
jgi:aminopeptidase